MKINFMPVVKRIEFSEYNHELAGVYADVWVNVPGEVIKKMGSVSAETPDKDFLALLHELWNAPGEHEELWPITDLEGLFAHCQERDPQLRNWLALRTWELISVYRGVPADTVNLLRSKIELISIGKAR